MLKTDSIAVLKKQIDSLNKVVSDYHSSQSWFKFNEAPVQAASIVALITLVTVLLGFIFKDYWIPHWTENRNKRKEGERLFALYKTNLFWAACTFNFRIKEIYSTRSHYLWTIGSPHTFYDYKYKSSVFRLCVLFGWIRAFKLLQSKMSINKGDEIDECIKSLESAFADGQQIEMYMAKTILDIAKVDTSKLKPGVIEKLSVEIDHLIFKGLESSQKKYLAEAPTDIQEKFIDDLTAQLRELKIQCSELFALKSSIIDVVSIKLGLIYRDWQQAIGDMMLLKEESNYTTISFRAFEEFWDSPDSPEKKWLIRAEVMFGNLNMTLDQQQDSRVKQLEVIYERGYQLLKTLYNSQTDTRPISKPDFDKITSTIK